MKIIYEDAWWLAVHKPAGLLVERHPRFPSVQAEVETWLRSRSPREPFVGIVHRLDRPVNGVLLLALRKQALKQLNEQFQNRTVKKTYRAWVQGGMPEKKGQLTHWLATDKKERIARIVSSAHPEGKLAELPYLVIGEEHGYTQVELYPMQGRFHQIRAQLAAAGCPILGDARYGSTMPYTSQGIALQAYKLAFDDPRSGKRVELEALDGPD